MCEEGSRLRFVGDGFLVRVPVSQLAFMLNAQPFGERHEEEHEGFVEGQGWFRSRRVHEAVQRSSLAADQEGARDCEVEGEGEEECDEVEASCCLT